MQQLLPGCKTGFQKSQLRIISEIREMLTRREIARLSEGWKKITDMLRAQYTCANTDQVLATLGMLE